MTTPARPAVPTALAGLTAYLLSQVARTAKRDLDDRLSARGMRLRHMAVLAALADPGQVSQLDVGRQLSIDASDMTGLLDDLERAGRVVREVDRADRRRRLLRLTDEGHSCLRELVDLAEQVAADLLAPLPPRRREALHADLARVFREGGAGRAADPLTSQGGRPRPA